MLDIIQATISKIEKRDKLTIKLIIDVSRTFGVENALANLNLTISHKTPMVTGIGLGGDEEKGPARLFKDVFELARKQGLHVVAHAGEVVGPESIWDALKELKVERIGHGISAIQDPELIKYLADNQIPVEICLTSNNHHPKVRHQGRGTSCPPVLRPRCVVRGQHGRPDVLQLHHY